MNLATGTRTSGRRGRPRDERIDRAITSAALEVIAEAGFEGFTVEVVAQRARVAKTTVYRRFPTRNELVVGALERLNDDLPPIPPPGPVRDRLVEALEAVRRRTSASTRGRILMHAAAEGSCDPALADLVQTRVLAPRREVLRSIIADGVDSGELRDGVDADAVLPVLVGPMLYLGMWGSVAPEVEVASVVDVVLTGLTRASDS